MLVYFGHSSSTVANGDSQAQIANSPKDAAQPDFPAGMLTDRTSASASSPFDLIGRCRSQLGQHRLHLRAQRISFNRA